MIGLSQILALFPGVSRSGMTIGSGFLSGIDEKEALRFSFLMAIPIILGANLVFASYGAFDFNILVGALVSFFVGLATIHWLYTRALVDRRNLKWFGLYALVLALVLGIIIII